jgi:hypothetical protein
MNNIEVKINMPGWKSKDIKSMGSFGPELSYQLWTIFLWINVI